LDRIFAEDYKPTWEDALAVYVPTKGLKHISFNYNGLSVSIVTFGGHQRQRQK
jgi:hypothetical protein